jgi:hypothetical protein
VGDLRLIGNRIGTAHSTADEANGWSGASVCCIAPCLLRKIITRQLAAWNLSTYGDFEFGHPDRTADDDGARRRQWTRLVQRSNADAVRRGPSPPSLRRSSREMTVATDVQSNATSKHGCRTGMSDRPQSGMTSTGPARRPLPSPRPDPSPRHRPTLRAPVGKEDPQHAPGQIDPRPRPRDIRR